MSHIKRLIVLILLGLISTAGASTGKYRLIWNSSPESSMTVAWCQTDGENPQVLYKEWSPEANNAPLQTHGVDHETSYLTLNSKFARLTGLKPNTAYRFLIRDSNSEGPKFWFKTAPAGEGSFSFAAGGDSRNHRDARQRANRTAAKLRPLFICFGGDMISSPTTKSWSEWLDDWQLTTGEDGRMIPIIAARGNHEGKNDIHLLFDSPIPDDYYAVGFGNGFLRIYTLNSNITRGGSQGAWLAEDLAAHAGTKWKLAQYHHPFRPHQAGKAEQHAQYNAWAALFYQHGLDFAVECDSHVVKRTWPVRPSNEPGSDQGFIRDDEHGITFVGEGCWGAPLRRNDDDKEWTRASGSFNQINWICIDPEKAILRTILVDDSVEAESVRDTDPFALPRGMQIWEPESGSTVTLTPRADPGSPPPVLGSLVRLKIIAAKPKFESSTLIRIETAGEVPDDAVIRFTTDETEPTAKSTEYREPFNIDKSTTIRAALFQNGKVTTSPSSLKVIRVDQ
jgi:hypothetical protein